MFIRYGNKSIEIKEPMNAINLELKFNLTPQGKVWNRIGDAFYYFRDIEVSLDQFYIMKTLIETHLSESMFSVVL